MSSSLLDINDEPGQHATSWYAATANPIATFPPAGGELRFDVVIVGAGFSGLSTALHLSQMGFSVAILEAHRIGWGASGRNGGQIGSGQRLDPQELEQLVGIELSRRAFKIGVDAADLVRELVSRHNMQCAIRHGSIEAFHRKRFNAWGMAKVEQVQQKYGYDCMSYISPEAMAEKVASPAYSGGILDTRAGHLHPLNFARGLASAAIAAGVRIFEMSRVKTITGGRPCKIKTANAELTADKVVLAANGYLGNLDKHVANRVMPINNFIIATEPLGDATCRNLIRDGECVHDSRFVVNYFRISQDHRLLFGGGENYSYRFPNNIVKTVRKPMLKIFPQLHDARIEFAWGGTLAITLNRVPHFEFRKNGIINISGYSGSGIHMACMAGKITAEAINGQMSNFDIMSRLPTPAFPGGTALRWPLLPLAMTWYAMRDLI